MLEYWTGPKHDYKFPKVVDWEYKTDTDLYEFAKVCLPYRFIGMKSWQTVLDASIQYIFITFQYKTVPTGLSLSPNGKLMATIAKDRKVSIAVFFYWKGHQLIDKSSPCKRSLKKIFPLHVD